MRYRVNPATGDEISQLGFGLLRLQKKGTGIDLDEAQRQILWALDHGVNYFDTAYIYGGCEAALGQIMARTGCRDRLLLATKLPHYLLKKPEDMERYFQEQLRRLQTDHIDYYLMHMLPDAATWRRLCGLGMEDWLAEKKRSGQIRRVGFSYHGNTVAFQELLTVYPWEFCQIQYNYMDEHSQAGRAGLQAAAKLGMAVIIMEPLRGGRLVNMLPKKAQSLLAETGRSPAEWGLRWLWDQPEVTCVLSGMNTMAMLEENVRIASAAEVGEMTDADQKRIAGVRAAINEKIKVGCTGCGYCMPCPQGVDIPGAFRSYNLRYTDNFYTGMKEYFMCTTLRAVPSNAGRCVGCGKCETHCPQGIPIRDKLKEVRRVLENPIYKIAARAKNLAGRFD